LANFVLVPGAWLGGWAWNRVTTILEKQGHGCFAVTLTGEGDRVHLAKDASIETAVQDVVNVIKYNDVDSSVLVGHSFAGKVAAAVADRVPEKVRMILYVDAYHPQKNNRGAQGRFNPTEFGEIKPGQTAVPFTESIIDMIGKDLTPPDRQWLLSKATPWPLRHSGDPITLSEKFDSIKNAFVFCTGGGDDVNELLKEKLDGPYKVMEAGHWPMISKPQELSEILVSLSNSV
jgi:pimeloyl-ACP methyl ester carboxylesterase